MARDIRITFSGRRLTGANRPAFLQRLQRGPGGHADPFLPAGYVEVASVHDLTLAARSSTDAGPCALTVTPDTVVILEMADGATVITSAARLRQSLAGIADQPTAVDIAPLMVLQSPAIARRGIVGAAAGDLVRRVITLAVGRDEDPIIADARRELARASPGRLRHVLATGAGFGATWLGTKALMWAIEKRLSQPPGLYRWIPSHGEAGTLIEVDEGRLAEDATRGPLLVFIHGTASSTDGSFGDLGGGTRNDWQVLAAPFADRVFAFEHRTLSESPIRNAIDLARRLPNGARLHLVTHSRGGIVGDLLCLDGVDRALIEQYRPDPSSGGGDAESRRLAREFASAYASHRRDLRELHRLLTSKRFVIERYVRVACPARGTRLASGNLDVFLSALLTVIGWVPALAANPIYSAFRRAVIEIARNRMDPRLVPGIEAMLPESPMARLLARARPRDGVAMAVIAGDTAGEEAGLLKRLGVLFTDFMFFDGFDNDLVVDTDSMYGGIAPAAGARCRFESGSKVSHFRYFENPQTRGAMRDWLTLPDVSKSEAFSPLSSVVDAAAPPRRRHRGAAARRRGVEASAPPIVVVVPGIMGSHLWINRRNRVWFDPAELLLGGLGRIRWGTRDIEAEEIFGRFYGDLCEFLTATHQVEPFAYDWRLPLDRLGDQFGLFLARRLRAAKRRPLRILAHSMGGLVARAAIYRRPDVVEPLMRRNGARLVMLGTPHQGSFAMVEALIGKADAIRMLGRLDLVHGLQEILDIVAGFRGALQLLPRTGFIDTGGRSVMDDFFRRSHWQLLRRSVRDFWFGNGVAAVPEQPALDAARWLWDQDACELADIAGRPTPSVWPVRHSARESELRAKTIHVHGQAARTPCGIERRGDRVLMLGTGQGDGSVTWASGTIRGIGATYYMPVEHAALTGTAAFFPAIEELLVRGETTQLATTAPAVRAAEAAPVPYDAGPPSYPMPGEVAAPLLGIRRTRAQRQARPSLAVSVRAMDLRFVTRPILAGHYEQDPISGAEAIIDAQLVGRRLSERYHMGMYAGPVGTVVVVLQPQNEAERRRGSLHGAVITGLGTLDGTLSEARLTEAVHAGVLRFLMHYADCIDQPVEDVALSTLLLGYNSSASLGIKGAVAALINGVSSANHKYLEATRRSLRVGTLEIVELYLDTALSTMYALRELVADQEAGRQRVEADLAIAPALDFGPGWRHRFDDSRGTGYWPRLMITDADRDETISEGAAQVSIGATASTAGHVDIARRLRFIQIGQRARAESIIKQRQPGAVEAIVERQIASSAYDADFCRTLFQLMVPHEFKDTARQLQRIVLVLDAYTANLPWELMLTDDTPLAVRTQVVRQFVSTRFRAQVRPTRRQEAYVIGNPSTEGFAAAFPGAVTTTLPDALEPLPRAEDEARRVVEVLRRNRFEVTDRIGVDCRALDVLNPLYRKEYRVVHIAAHGVVDIVHRDGKPRTGVVLSNGLLITAAEIEAMERVPDLVFLNCCHLARITVGPIALNRLACSIARELIEIGVRCVVAAGWPVDDQAAEMFAVTFYESLLARGMAFGDAVFEARVRVHAAFPASMTWGAYQAYGDPGWQMGGDVASGSPAIAYVSPLELAERIERLTIDLNQQGRILGDAEADEMAGEIAQITRRGSRQWLEHPLVLTALAAAHAQLGPRHFEAARSYYRRAIAAEDGQGQVPIRAIEQLANIEARQGESCDDIALVESAIRRIESLLGSVASGAEEDLPANGQRLATLASAYKRRAACHARAVIRGEGAAARRAFREAIARSIALYDAVALAGGGLVPRPYPAINGLALRTVHGPLPADPATLIDRCIETATSDFARSAGFWDAVVVADAECVRAIVSGELAAGGPTGEATLERLKVAYRSSLAHVQLHPKRLSTVAGQLAMLALFHRAAARGNGSVLAQRLQWLADWLSAMARGTASENPTVSGVVGAEATDTDDGAPPSVKRRPAPAGGRRNRAGGRRPPGRRR